ncbi:potassium channel protein [Halobacteriales archaeon QH_10_67_13]|nr:MAG: potassium channel protein [Halobacteriales archaeon QH_10_67_13]
MAPTGGDDQQSVEYRPVGVTELLSAMKDTSELLVDLAYSALLHDSPDLAEEVLALESRMDRLQLQARMNLLMSARNPTDAGQLAPVLGIVGATEKISEAAGDIAAVVLDETALPAAIRARLPDAVEVLARAELVAASPYADRRLGAIDLETETGVRVIAVRTADGWTIDPDAETRLDPGAVLLLRGDDESITGVYETVTGEPHERDPADPDTGFDPDAGERDIADLDRAVTSIVLMKDVSELAVDLAYASVLFDDEALAREVRSLEVETDALQSRLETWTLRAAGQLDDPASLAGLLGIANGTEQISDAALEISEGILRDIDTHPVIAESVRESDLAVRRVTVGERHRLAGATLAEVYDAYPGVSAIAIRRDDEWLFYPNESTTIAAEDVLIVRGTWAATDELVAD